MALDAYVKTCGKNVAGNYRKVFFGLATEVDTVTVSNAPYELTAITNSDKFKAFTAEIDSVQFKVEGTGGSNYYTTQTLTLKFAKKSKALITQLEELKAAVTCGVCAIHVDGNGVAWLTGYDARATDPTARPYNKIKITFDSGAKPSDAEGNMVTVELTRESEWQPIPFDATVSGAIINETATTYIAYS